MKLKIFEQTYDPVMEGQDILDTYGTLQNPKTSIEANLDVSGSFLLHIFIVPTLPHPTPPKLSPTAFLNLLFFNFFKSESLEIGSIHHGNGKLY